MPKIRCLSHNDFSLTLENSEKLLHEGSCSRRAMLSCYCPTCRPLPPKLFRIDELESRRHVAVQPSTSIRITKTNSMSMSLDYEPAEQSGAKAGKEELTESVKNQMTGKSEIETANSNYCIANCYTESILTPESTKNYINMKEAIKSTLHLKLFESNRQLLEVTLRKKRLYKPYDKCNLTHAKVIAKMRIRTEYLPPILIEDNDSQTLCNLLGNYPSFIIVIEIVLREPSQYALMNA
ncbi:hypothetical protein X798_02555 [Onchocerca flexuosa]|uniref:Uncharacterized protein n=1 Tax=Onchocerca flexuosa TaxID=387005 RepID=A0A238BZ36_9BILA|nr:hypothetical protein X798_02555 [Onchocerca flexuosa]